MARYLAVVNALLGADANMKQAKQNGVTPLSHRCPERPLGPSAAPARDKFEG